MSYTGSRCEGIKKQQYIEVQERAITIINAGPNTTILYASIVAAVLFGLLVVLISAVLIFKCRQLRRKKVNNTSRWDIEDILVNTEWHCIHHKKNNSLNGLEYLPWQALKEEQDNTASSTTRHNSGENIKHGVLKEIQINNTTAQIVSENVTPSQEHETISLLTNNKKCEILEPNNKLNLNRTESSKSLDSVTVLYSVTLPTAIKSWISTKRNST